MKTNLTLILLLAIVVFSCGLKDENAELKLKNEELEAELNRAKMGVSTLEQIGALMDSIDSKRNAIQLDLEKGTSYEDYLSRMEELTNYIEETENKISSMESQFADVSQKNKAYLTTISRLKKDLTTKTEEIDRLKASVEEYKSENQNLLTLVELQEAEINDKAEVIERKREELQLLENRMQELMTQAQVSEADAYYARAAAVEEAANRTKLAPKKKKETYTEALELYKRSYGLGREDAQEKIKELEEKI